MHGWGVSTRVGRFGLALAVIVLLSPARAPAGQAGTGADRRALVIGNSAYVAVSELPNPKLRVVDRPVARSPGGERQRVARVVMSVSASVGAAGAVSR